MTTEVKRRSHYLEGGNLLAIITVPIFIILSVIFYGRLVSFFKPLEIKIEDVFSYSFNLFALQIGALLALYALFVCRPTSFLERMKNTNVFEAILSNTKLTMWLITGMLVATGILGLLRIEPEAHLNLKSLAFLLWCGGFIGSVLSYVRTNRLVFTALD